MFLLFIVRALGSGLLLLAPVREWFKYLLNGLNHLFQDFSQENLNENKSECKLHLYSLSPRVFFSFFPSQISLPFPQVTPQRGTTVHLFQFKSAFKYLLNELTSFDIELFSHYLSFLCHFVVQVFVERAVSNILSAFSSHILFCHLIIQVFV